MKINWKKIKTKLNTAFVRLKSKLAYFVLIISLYVKIPMPRALASEADGVTDIAKDPNNPRGLQFFKFMNVHDSYNVLVWNYSFSGWKGGATEFSHQFWQTIMPIFYNNYVVLAGIALWLMDYVLRFGWLNIFYTPLAAIDDGIRRALDLSGLQSLFIMLIPAGVGLYFMLKGNKGAAIKNIFYGMMITGIATGITISPFKAILNPEDGYIIQARNFSVQMAGLLINVENIENADTEDINAIIKNLQTTLVDSTIRLPLQLGNFGTIIDRELPSGIKVDGLGGDCVKEYNLGFSASPSEDDRQRRNLDGCKDHTGSTEKGDTASAYGNDPNANMWFQFLILDFISFCILVMILVLTWRVVLAALKVAIKAMSLYVLIFFSPIPAGRKFLVKQLLTGLIQFLNMFMSIVLVVVVMDYAGLFLASANTTSEVYKHLLGVIIVFIASIYALIKMPAWTEKISTRIDGQKSALEVEVDDEVAKSVEKENSNSETTNDITIPKPAYEPGADELAEAEHLPSEDMGVEQDSSVFEKVSESETEKIGSSEQSENDRAVENAFAQSSENITNNNSDNIQNISNENNDSQISTTAQNDDSYYENYLESEGLSEREESDFNEIINHNYGYGEDVENEIANENVQYESDEDQELLDIASRMRNQ